MIENTFPKIELSFQGRNYSAEVRPVPMQQYFVCFMDLLGTKYNVLSGHDKRFVGVLHALCQICGQIQAAQLPNLKIKTFSDNICLLVPIPNDLESAKHSFQLILELVSWFQIMLLVNTGELVRGGLAAGEAFCDNDFVWVKALVKAYDIEASKVIIPVIGIEPSTFDTYVEGNCHGLALKRAASEIPFVNYPALLSAKNAMRYIPIFPLALPS